MTYDDLIRHYGSAEIAGAALKGTSVSHDRVVTRQGVHRWKAAGIPVQYQIEYEVITGGALRADLPKMIRANRLSAAAT